MTKRGFFVLGLIIIAIIVAGIFLFSKSDAGKELVQQEENKVQGVEEGPNGEKPVKVSVNTWGGFAGGIYMNNGFSSNTDCKLYKEHGVLAEFILQDDFDASRSAWKSGDVDLLWATLGAFTTEAEGLKEYKPLIIMQVDWSRGGDVLVVNRNIQNARDLKGKTVAYAPMTPSHELLIWFLKSADLTINDIQKKEVGGAIEAANMFMAGEVDAAFTWSPNDQDCLSKVAGSKVLASTRDISHLIADVMLVKESILQTKKTEIDKLVYAWLLGNAELNNSTDAKRIAAKLLSDKWNTPEAFALQSIGNARLCTIGDNYNFFNIKGDYKGVTAEEIYTNMASSFTNLGVITTAPIWKNVGSSLVVKNLKLQGPFNMAEGEKQFTPPSEQIKTKDAFTTKRITITFPTGKFTLDDNAKFKIDKEFIPIAKKTTTRIRIEGNTDNVGSKEKNKTLSLQRAQSVANYLIEEYGFDPNRLIIVGNGPEVPVADNDTEEGKAKNRRTDFELIAE